VFFVYPSPCLRFTGTTAVARTVCIDPGIQLHSIERDSSIADGDLMHKGAYLTIKAIAIHAQVGRGMPKAQKTRRKRKALH